jgi:hypothetical protein
MKKFTLSILFLTITFFTYSQDIILYGFLPSSPDTEFLRLAHFDPISGNVVDEDSIYSATAYALGSSSFDAVQKAFIFIGADTAWNFRLYTRAIRTKSTISSPVFSETLNDLQYDMNSMNTYGMGSYISDSTLIDTLNDFWEYQYATRFMQIEQESGVLTELNQMPDISAFPAGSSTFDANNGRYIVNAYDTSFVERMVVIDAATGTVLSKEPIGLNAGDYLNNLEYNNEDDKIYGFYRGSDNTYYALISIDINNEFEVDTIYTFTDLQYFFQGGAVFHQASQSYIMFYIDTTNTNRIAVIDVLTGDLTANPISNESISEIEVDNTEYALAKYHETVGILDELNSNKEFVIYPNPISSGASLHYQGKTVPEQIRIYNARGVLVDFHKNLNQNITINTGEIKPGVYLISIQTKNRIETHKVLIR